MHIFKALLRLKGIFIVVIVCLSIPIIPTPAVAALRTTHQQINLVRNSDSPTLSITFTPSRGSSSSSDIVDHALSLLGTPYIFGGTTRRGFDCSGFTKYVFAGSGIYIPRTSYAQFSSGTVVEKNTLRLGDLVFFSTYSKGASHVGIYLGGGRFVHASNPTNGIEISSLSDNFYSSRYLGARRYNTENFVLSN